MRKIAYYLLILVAYLFLLPSTTFALENFTTSYDVTYAVLDDLTTHATFRVTLTNTTSQYYASSYAIRVGFTNIKNVEASDPDGKISPDISQTEDGQSITITFNKKVVGIGNKLPFTLSFDTKEIIEQHGNIWELNIPGIINQDDLEDFNVHVTVPTFLGSPTYIKPSQPKTTLDFSKEQLGKSGISITFGNEQYYGFTLSYHLKNSHVFPIKTEIALPLPTNYQEVLIDDLSPRPNNVKTDADGNWLAEYSLMPYKKIDVVVKGKVKISLYPKQENVSEGKLMEYLKEKPYWETNEQIKKLARELKTPEAIYQYVVNTLTYDFSRVTGNSPRLGAMAVLDNPSSAVCLEFTDLFIAIARSAGIPAREVNGFAYTQNTKQRPLSLVKDILHAWPEYYDREQKAWIMVDPTWGNTTGGVDYFHTLDFDHVAFVIKGAESDYPIPAGGYKLPGFENTKDVSMGFAKQFDSLTPTIKVSSHFPKETISYLPIQGSISLKNEGRVSYPSQLLIIAGSDILTPRVQKVVLADIPPFGFLDIPVSFDRTPFLTNKDTTVTIQLGKDKIIDHIRISPVFLTKLGLLGGGVAFAISSIIIFIIAQKSRRLPFFKQEG